MEKRKINLQQAYLFITGCLVLNSQNHRDSIVWPKYLMPKFDVKVMIWFPALGFKVRFLPFAFTCLFPPLRCLKIPFQNLTRAYIDQNATDGSCNDHFSCLSQLLEKMTGNWTWEPNSILESRVQCHLSLFFTTKHQYFPNIFSFLHYVLVFPYYSLDKSAPLVVSDGHAATAFAIVDWVILHTAGKWDCSVESDWWWLECRGTWMNRDWSSSLETRGLT